MIQNSKTGLSPNMNFHRITTRTILRTLISRKSNDKVSWKCKKADIWCVLQFGTIYPIIKHKSTCGGTLILKKVGECSAAFLKHSSPNDANYPKSKTRQIFMLFCYLIFWKLEHTCNEKAFRIMKFRNKMLP